MQVGFLAFCPHSDLRLHAIYPITLFHLLRVRFRFDDFLTRFFVLPLDDGLDDFILHFEVGKASESIEEEIECTLHFILVQSKFRDQFMMSCGGKWYILMT